MSSTDEAAPNYHVPALERGLDLLEHLSGRGVALTQSQLARELGRKPAEMFRALTTLERRGYIHRDPASGAYALTLRLFELGHTHSPFEQLVRAADEPMRALTATTQQGCHLSAIHHFHLLVLHQVESPARVRVSVEIGSTITLHRAASGRVLLANLDDDRRRDLLARNDDYRALGEPERARLQSRLERIRERGYEDAYSESTRGVTDIAVLVGQPGGVINAALAIAALPRERGAFLRETVEPLRQCANSISEAAGLIVPEGE